MTVLPALLADEVRRHGFAVWPGYASPQECAVLQESTTALAGGEHANHYPKSTRVWDLYQFHLVYTDLLTKPGLVDLLDDLLGRYHLLSDYSLNVVNPGQPVDDWHIDYPFNEMRQLISGGVLGLQCVLTVNSFTEANGATRLLPGTHEHPARPTKDASAPEVFLTGEPGTLLIMAAATWHRSGFNSSTHPRTAVLMSFVERWIKPLSDPLPQSLWAFDERLHVLLGLERPAETINGVPV